MKYGEISNDFKMYTGGMGTAPTQSRDINTREITNYFDVKVKFLYENKKKAIDLIREVLINTKFEDKKLVKEYIAEMRSQGEGMLTSVPHSIAAGRTVSYFDKYSKLSDALLGLESVRFIQEIDDIIDDRIDEVLATVKSLAVKIFREENLFINMTVSEGDDHIADEELKKVSGGMKVATEETDSILKIIIDFFFKKKTN